ncbi:MAG: alpha/beta hydrolase, partial [Campylobacterales bacterium]|nr:alpha/beta hydrolase [Campylobacterales bacterium]
KIFKFLKKFFGDSMYKLFATKDADGMPKNMYETIKNVVDEDFTPHFAAFANRAIVFWGENDKATSLESGKKIASLIRNSKFYSFDGDHYFFLRNSEKVEKLFLDEAL